MARTEDMVSADLFPTLVDHVGITVTYYRDGSQVGTMDAVKGSRMTELMGSESTTTAISDDFIVKYTDLVTLGVGMPRRRDTLSWTDTHGTTHVQEVTMPGAEREYDFVDQMHVLVRIHTKEIDD